MSELTHLARITPGASNATYTTGSDISFDGTVTTMSITDGGPRIVRLTVSLATSGVLSVRTNSVDMPLNSGVPLAAGCLYTFEFVVHQNSFSFRSSVSTVINFFCVAYGR